MVYCPLGSNETTKFTGYDVEMIRLIAKRLDLKVLGEVAHTLDWAPFICDTLRHPISQEDVDFTMHCMPFLDIVESLKTREGRCRNCDDCSVCQTDCDIGVSGITITLQRQEEGIVFSYPYYKACVVQMSRCMTAIPKMSLQVARSPRAGDGWHHWWLELDQALYLGPLACGAYKLPRDTISQSS